MSSSFTIAIAKTAMADMPAESFGGEITVVDTPEAADAAIEAIRAMPLVGFDTETRPAFRKGESHTVALMQVSGADRCFLFRICHTGITDSIAAWLADGACAKVGLSLKDDFHQLHRLRDFEPAGFTELQQMVRRWHITDASLQKIYAILFGRRISKGQRLTNWEAAALSPAQQGYAALDAFACLRIYRYLESGLFVPAESPYRIDPSPASPQ